MTTFSHTLVVLLGLDNVATKHLRIFDFDLRIVEYIIIVVYVLYYFNWLILLFLGLGRAASPGSMWSMELATHWLGLTKVILVWIGEILLVTCEITSLNLAITH